MAAATVYAVFGSKEGILRALMSTALFGERYQEALTRLQTETDPVRLLALTAQVARAV